MKRDCFYWGHRVHWLPVRHRVAFKIAVLVFQCLTGQGPAYLADDCQLTSDVHTRRLRSTDTVMFVVRRSNNTFGDRCFASAGPRLWNTLPPHLRRCDSLGQFKRLLKTHLFGSWDRGALTFLLGAPCINLLTHLLTYLGWMYGMCVFIPPSHSCLLCLQRMSGVV